ncbi:MFS transporter [Streptomyces sp. LX-29]|uniref:MFS transporter n=1 Tax=Streptomyces sp. LX-29 TaxID=2900152 RepID=UPI00240D7253|nr:MFS transporter [Streptomyces sp. LX-29]WFB09674.1 MFS transporter [Streptomyces sp. LX-29]
MSEALESGPAAPAPRGRAPSKVPEPANPGGGTALAAVCLGFFMVLMDASALNVALPRLRAELGGGLAPLEWTVNSYTIAMAACLLGGGALADRLGARRLFELSLLLFVAASAACAASPGLGALIAARTVQGVAAGGLLPASLAVIAHMYPEPARRAKAFTIWGGVSSLALVIGPVAGGALTAAVGWRAIFLINVPIGLLAVAGCRRRLAPSPTRAVPLDPWGQLAAAVVVGCGIGALVEGGSHGWSAPLPLTLLGAAALAAVAFGLAERAARHPVLPLGVLRRPGFAAGLGLGALFQFGAYGGQFALSLHLQHRWGLGALGAGLAFVPFASCWAFASFVLARAVTRTGPRLLLIVGSAGAAAGALALLPLSGGRDWPLFTVGSCLLGLGAGLMGPSLPTVVLRSLPPDQSGLASGSLNALRQVGGAIGVALFGPLLDGRGDAGLRVCLALVALGFAAAALVVRHSMPAVTRARPADIRTT